MGSTARVFLSLIDLDSIDPVSGSVPGLSTRDEVMESEPTPLAPTLDSPSSDIDGILAAMQKLLQYGCQ